MSNTNRSKTTTTPFTFDKTVELARWTAWKATGYAPIPAGK